MTQEKTTTTKRRAAPAKTEVQPESNSSNLEVQMKEAAEANAAFAEENDKLAKENAELKAMMAKNSPSVIRKTTDSEDFQQGQDHAFEFADDNTIIQAKAEEIEDPARRGKLDYLRFMEEPVTVHITESNDTNAEQTFPIWVNGKVEYFTEGKEKVVARKFAEGLAVAKRTSYRNVQKTKDDGENSYQYIPKTGVRYPFSVVEDKNPKGRAWLEAVLRQP